VLTCNKKIHKKYKKLIFLSDEEETGSVKSLGKEAKLDEDDGGEFVVEEEEKDDEETIAAEEKLHEGDDYQSELDDLQKEGFYIFYIQKQKITKAKCIL